MIIGIQDEILRLHSLGLLEGLLADKTTGGNIIWATDAYQDLGEEYGRNREITAGLITGKHAGVIKNRACKDLEDQSARTRQHAEVFTPLWVCNKMNDYLDEEWFGKPNVFHVDGKPTKRVVFPEGKTWRDYVDSRRLEITCGEAPYLVSRYDVSTGEGISIPERIGILDRKLRVVGERTRTEIGWLNQAARAFQSTYGYEFQGDNVLIARVNLLMTYEEYLEDRWHRKPTQTEYQNITEIIIWNIWQMDGLTGNIPYSQAAEEYEQVSLFGDEPEEPTHPPCRIYDWREKRSVGYIWMKEGGTGA